MARCLITSSMFCSMVLVLLSSSPSSFNVGGVIVSKNGDGDYTSISEAIAKAPSFSRMRYIIEVKGGIYEEYLKIPSDKTNILLIGAGPQVTRITGNRNTATDQSATIGIVCILVFISNIISSFSARVCYGLYILGIAS